MKVTACSGPLHGTHSIRAICAFDSPSGSNEFPASTSAKGFRVEGQSAQTRHFVVETDQSDAAVQAHRLRGFSSRIELPRAPTFRVRGTPPKLLACACASPGLAQHHEVVAGWTMWCVSRGEWQRHRQTGDRASVIRFVDQPPDTAFDHLFHAAFKTAKDHPYNPANHDYGHRLV